MVAEPTGITLAGRGAAAAAVEFADAADGEDWDCACDSLDVPEPQAARKIANNGQIASRALPVVLETIAWFLICESDYHLERFRKAS